MKNDIRQGFTLIELLKDSRETRELTGETAVLPMENFRSLNPARVRRCGWQRKADVVYSINAVRGSSRRPRCNMIRIGREMC
jgi:predicted Zn-ribbon and HTH transcriptional regulator